jgi:hypothetical protein
MIDGENMNQFQKQLVFNNGKCMAEIAGDHRDGVGEPFAPKKITVGEFMADLDVTTMGMIGLPAQYIGDGVYATWDGFQITLMANSRENPTDVIYLEPEVLEALNKFYQLCTKGQEDGRA